MTQPIETEFPDLFLLQFAKKGCLYGLSERLVSLSDMAGCATTEQHSARYIQIVAGDCVVEMILVPQPAVLCSSDGLLERCPGVPYDPFLAHQIAMLQLYNNTIIMYKDLSIASPWDLIQMPPRAGADGISVSRSTISSSRSAVKTICFLYGQKLCE